MAKTASDLRSSSYRSRSSYVSKDPERRQRSLDNLKKRWDRNKPNAEQAEQVVKVDRKPLRKVNIIDFATEYLGISFKERPGQEAVLRVLYGLPLDADQLELYRQLTTNKEVFEPNIEKTEADLDIGARGGKSFMVSVIALYESIVKAGHWHKYLRKDEVGYAIITATRQKQCEDIIQASCTTLLANSSLKYYIEDDLTSELKLKNGLTIASMPCNSTAARGLPIFLLIFDEMAFYRVEGVKADYKIFNALNPRRAQFPGAKCLKVTTPAGKQGLFWDEFSQGFSVPGRLTIKAHTRLMNPVIPQDFIDKEYKRDPDNAAREFGAEFAETASGFFATCSQKLTECFQLAEDVLYQPGQVYCASIDQSGLSGQDRFAFSICHREYKLGDKVIQDILRLWDTRESDVALEEIKCLCATYHIGKIYIDNYAKGWVTDALSKKGLSAEVAERLPVVYSNFKTLVLMNRLTLQDHPNLKKGLLSTQAYYGKSNTLSIGHERTREGHGDAADATVRSVYGASQDYTVGALRNNDRDMSYRGAYDNNVLTRGLRVGSKRRIII